MGENHWLYRLLTFTAKAIHNIDYAAAWYLQRWGVEMIEHGFIRPSLWMAVG
jgi:hypothetical protein